MSVELESLDDIIKKSKIRNPLRGRGRGRGGRGGGIGRGATRSSDHSKPILERPRPNIRGRGISRGITRGINRSNGSIRGGSKVIEDARMKIIQKNRQKVKDAREKLSQMAKHTDARNKLRNRNFNSREMPVAMPRRPMRNGRIGLSNNKLPPLGHRPLAPPILQTTIRNTSYRPHLAEPHYMGNMMMTYNDDYMMPAVPMRRTISNEYSIPAPAPIPVFSVKSSYVDWDKPETEHMPPPPPPPPPRPAPMRSSDHDRPREYKVLARSSVSKSDSHSYRNEYYPPKSTSSSSSSRTVLADNSDKYYSSSRSQSSRSRPDSSPKSSRSIPSSRTKPTSSSSSSSSSSSNGYRIVVSNLQPNVTQEDIKELFEDVGELLISRLVRPGIAEVVYKTLSDAIKAVETYHNRQLDGHPMKCLLVNTKPKTSSSSSSSSRGVLQHARGSSYSSRPPSVGTVHRALFDRNAM